MLTAGAVLPGLQEVLIAQTSTLYDHFLDLASRIPWNQKSSL